MIRLKLDKKNDAYSQNDQSWYFAILNIKPNNLTIFKA